MAPELEAVQQESWRVFKLDVGEYRQSAREFGIRATPTVLVVRQDRIRRCIVGTGNRNRL